MIKPKTKRLRHLNIIAMKFWIVRLVDKFINLVAYKELLQKFENNNYHKKPIEACSVFVSIVFVARKYVYKRSL